MAKTKTKEKEFTIEDMKKAGVLIMTANEYGLEKLIRMKPKGIEEARKILSKVKTSLSDEIIKARRAGL